MYFSSIKFEGQVSLKKGREFSVQKQHPWIFSGAIENTSLETTFQNGSIVKVFSFQKKFLGAAFYNQNASLALRFLSFNNPELPPAQILINNVKNAISLRKACFDSDTNCFRLINAEGDLLPGLILDCYDRTLVLQSSIISIDLIKTELLQLLIDELKPLSIYEKSNSSSRKLDGLAACEQVLYGAEPADQIVQENSRKLYVNVKTGQKTGMFLDHREMRNLVADLSKDKKVLNCFSYSGAFSIAALQAGAQKVISVDCSEQALEHCKKNTGLNNFDESKHQAICQDAFEYLEQLSSEADKEKFDVVIVDPPAFAKNKKDIRNALKAYYQINFLATKVIKKGGILISCSCSNFVSKEDFDLEVLAAVKSNSRVAKVIGEHRLALDHPVLAAHTEGRYLKSLVLSII